MDITKTMLEVWDGRVHSLSDGEKARRLAAVRKLLEESGASALVAIEMDKGGYYQWLTGACISERPSEEVIVVPPEGRMIMSLTSRLFSDEEQARYRKLDDHKSQDFRDDYTDNVPALHYRYVADHLGPGKKAGFVFLDAIRKNMRDYLFGSIPGLSLVDLTAGMERLKAIKSGEEIAIIEAVAGLHDRLFATAACAIRSGRLESEVVRELRARAYQMGSGGEDVTRTVVVDLSSSPEGDKASVEPLAYPGRRLAHGDRINLFVRCIGYDDYYGALGRCFVIGQPSEETRRLWALAVGAQDAAVGALRTGNRIADAMSAANAYLVENGIEPDESAFVYGMGYLIGEAPCPGTPSADMALEAGMTLAVAPRVSARGMDPFRCADLFLVTPGGARRLTAFPRKLVVL